MSRKNKARSKAARRSAFSNKAPIETIATAPSAPAAPAVPAVPAASASEAVTNRSSYPEGSLFHYTTAAGLIGILGTQELWATHAGFLNDTAECRLLTALLAPQVAKEFEDVIPRLISAGAFKSEIKDAIRGDALHTEAEKVSAVAVKAIERVSPIYVTSFCMHAKGSPESEHGLLSQWRGYGRGGFAIEFDEAELDKLTDYEFKQKSYQAIITRKVAYDDHAKAAQLDRFEGLAAASLKVAFTNTAPALAARPDVKEILGDREIASYMKAFFNALPFLKSPRFKEENEYRIVASATLPSQEIGDDLPYQNINFREGDGGSVVPFIKLFGQQDVKLPIRKIIVGPHRDQENQYNAVKLLVEQNKIKADIRRSDTSLRI